jgi:RNA polymerase sigma factor (sigma-70 family)
VAVPTTICVVAQGGDRGQRQDALTDTPDRLLAARLAAGDPDALAEAYRRFGGLVFGLCRRVLNDETLAEDVAQEVFLYLWQSPEQFDPARGSLRSWLALLAHRRSVDRVRAETRRSRAETRGETTSIVADKADDDMTVDWLSNMVRNALGKLPPEQREAVVLAYYGGRTYRQVAVELAIPEGTAKSRLRLAMVRLNTLLRAEYADQDARAWT